MPDVNVLIALIDAHHVHRQEAIEWHQSVLDHELLICPITENGAIRVVSNPRYPGGPLLPFEVCDSLAQLYRIGKWDYLCEDVWLTHKSHFRREGLLDCKQLTDTYLLGLCAFHGIRYATMDRKIQTRGLNAVPNDLILLV